MRPIDTRDRVFRGGAWNLVDAFATSPGYHYMWNDPILTDTHLGFRTFRRVREVRR